MMNAPSCTNLSCSASLDAAAAAASFLAACHTASVTPSSVPPACSSSRSAVRPRASGRPASAFRNSGPPASTSLRSRCASGSESDWIVVLLCISASAIGVERSSVDAAQPASDHSPSVFAVAASDFFGAAAGAAAGARADGSLLPSSMPLRD